MNRVVRRPNQRGISTLEMVAVLPPLLLILFGSLELSRAWLTVNLVTTAAREGARAGAVATAGQFPNPPTAVTRIDDILGAGRWTGQVSCSASPCAPDAEVHADVSVTYQTLLPALLPMLDSLQIRRVAVMRYE